MKEKEIALKPEARLKNHREGHVTPEEMLEMSKTVQSAPCITTNITKKRDRL